MAMKKLYAKTSFSSKKPNAVVASSGPILAYHQSSGPAGGMCEFQTPKGAPVPAPGAATQPAGELIRRSQSLHRVKGLSEYYSIEELQELDLLDYRHPMYHHYQQQQQQQQEQEQEQELLLRQRSAYHEHEQLVLQLPKADRGAAPIYEAPYQQHQRSVQDQTLYVQPPSATSAPVAAHTIATPSTSTSASTSHSSASSSSSSSVLFSTLRKCVSPSNSTNSNPPAASTFCPTSSSSCATSSASSSTSTSCSYPSKAGPSRLACSMSLSIRTIPSSSSAAATST